MQVFLDQDSAESIEAMNQILNQMIRPSDVLAAVLLTTLVTLSIVWIADPQMIGANWARRAQLFVVVFTITGLVAGIPLLKQLRGQRLARNYIERICQLDFYEIDEQTITAQLPTKHTAWRKL